MKDDERKLQEDVRRAEHAQRILNDVLVKEALAGIEATLYHNIKTSSYKQAEEREECYRMLRVIDTFRSQFEAHIRNGKVSRSRLEALLNAIKR